MRIAAGILLIVVAVVLVVGAIIDFIGYMSDFGSHTGAVSILLAIGAIPIILGSLLVAGGVLCFKRRHWGVCLVSALITLCFWIIPGVAMLSGGEIYDIWRFGIVVLGAIISTIFISLTKKEWQEFSDSVDGKVTYGG